MKLEMRTALPTTVRGMCLTLFRKGATLFIWEWLSNVQVNGSGFRLDSSCVHIKNACWHTSYLSFYQTLYLAVCRENSIKQMSRKQKEALPHGNTCWQIFEYTRFARMKHTHTSLDARYDRCGTLWLKRFLHDRAPFGIQTCRTFLQKPFLGVGIKFLK